MGHLPIDYAIMARINRLLDQASEGYGDETSCVTVLGDAWRRINYARQNEGLSDSLSVCVEHYLYARYRSAEGVYGEIEQRIVTVLYPFKNPPDQLLNQASQLLNHFGISSLPQIRTSRHAASQYEFSHTYWEHEGIGHGMSDRGRTLPITRYFIS